MVESTFGPRSTKLAPGLHIPKIVIAIEDFWVPTKVDSEKNGQKLILLVVLAKIGILGLFGQILVYTIH